MKLRMFLVLAVLSTTLMLSIRAPWSLALAAAGGELPPGTIVAWSPPAGVTGPPPGWLLCDRATHEAHPWVPDLSERFLWGAGVPFAPPDSGLESDLGHRGGSVAHEHPGSQTPRALVRSIRAERQSLGRELADANHEHRVEVRSDRHLPPFHKVAFIIKAD